MISYLIASTIGAAVGVGGVAFLWMWQAARGRSSVVHTGRDMSHGGDGLSRWEELALLATGAASAFNVLLWALGYHLTDAAPALTPLGVLRVAFAVLSFVSMDLVVIVTVMAMRAGRRGLWSEVCSVVAALAAAGIALEVSGVVVWPWLHAAPMLVLYTFMRHLAAPKAVQRPAVLAQERDALRVERDALTRERDELKREAGRVPDLLGQRDAEVDQLRDELAQARAALDHAASDVDHWRGMAAQAAARPALTADHETITLAGRAYSMRDAAEALGISKTTLGRKLTEWDKQRGE